MRILVLSSAILKSSLRVAVEVVEVMEVVKVMEVTKVDQVGDGMKVIQVREVGR